MSRLRFVLVTFTLVLAFCVNSQDTALCEQKTGSSPTSASTIGASVRQVVNPSKSVTEGWWTAGLIRERPLPEEKKTDSRSTSNSTIGAGVRQAVNPSKSVTEGWWMADLIMEDPLPEVASPEEAFQSCGSCGGDCEAPGQCVTCTPCTPTFIDGWVTLGFTRNPDNPSSHFNGPLTFNDRTNEFQMNQLYLGMGRHVIPDGCSFDFGGSVDLLFGTDYFFTTATGLETRRDGSPWWNGSDGPRAGGATLYGLAMPQLYAEFSVPFGNGLSLKLGHFYSILGHESVMAPENFFYSHSYVLQYGRPFTHTGILSEHRLTQAMRLQAGFTRGWDSWEDANGQLGFLGGISWTSCDHRKSIRFALHSGNEDDSGESNRTTYSLVLSHQLPCCMTYVLEHTLGTEENAAERNDDLVDADWYGIAQYLMCQVNPMTELGLRFEWFRDEENARVLSIPLDEASGGNYYALSLGLNFRPWCDDRFRIGPEFRWDWSDTELLDLGVRGMFDDFTQQGQFTIAVSAIARF